MGRDASKSAGGAERQAQRELTARERLEHPRIEYERHTELPFCMVTDRNQHAVVFLRPPGRGTKTGSPYVNCGSEKRCMRACRRMTARLRGEQSLLELDTFATGTVSRCCWVHRNGARA